MRKKKHEEEEGGLASGAILEHEGDTA